MMIKPRIAKVRPFVGTRQRECDTAGEVVFGFTTYGTNDSDQETYQTSYLGLSARSDHLGDMIANAQGNDVTVRTVDGNTDTDFVGSADQNVKPDKKDSTES